MELKYKGGAQHWLINKSLTTVFGDLNCCGCNKNHCLELITVNILTDKHGAMESLQTSQYMWENSEILELTSLQLHIGHA